MIPQFGFNRGRFTRSYIQESIIYGVHNPDNTEKLIEIKKGDIALT